MEHVTTELVRRKGSFTTRKLSKVFPKSDISLIYILESVRIENKTRSLREQRQKVKKYPNRVRQFQSLKTKKRKKFYNQYDDVDRSSRAKK